GDFPRALSRHGHFMTPINTAPFSPPLALLSSCPLCHRAPVNLARPPGVICWHATYEKSSADLRSFTIRALSARIGKGRSAGCPWVEEQRRSTASLLPVRVSVPPSVRLSGLAESQGCLGSGQPGKPDLLKMQIVLVGLFAFHLEALLRQ